jgi:hypothetical protein
MSCRTLVHQRGAHCLSLDSYVNSYNEMEESHNQDWMLGREKLSMLCMCQVF